MTERDLLPLMAAIIYAAQNRDGVPHMNIRPDDDDHQKAIEKAVVAAGAILSECEEYWPTDEDSDEQTS